MSCCLRMKGTLQLHNDVHRHLAVYHCLLDNYVTQKSTIDYVIQKSTIENQKLFDSNKNMISGSLSLLNDECKITNMHYLQDNFQMMREHDRT